MASLGEALNMSFSESQKKQRSLAWRMRLVFVGSALFILALALPAMTVDLFGFGGFFGACVAIAPIVALVAVRPTEVLLVRTCSWVLVFLCVFGGGLFSLELTENLACAPSVSNATATNATTLPDAISTAATVCMLSAAGNVIRLLLVILCVVIAGPPHIPRCYPDRMSTRVRMYRMFAATDFFVGVDGAVHAARYVALGMIDSSRVGTHDWNAQLIGGLTQLVVALLLSSPRLRRRLVGALSQSCGTAGTHRAAVIAALVGGRTPEEVLRLTRDGFKVIRWSKLSEVGSRAGRKGCFADSDLSSSNVLYAMTETVELGKADCFLSHSWRDDGALKWVALTLWTQKLMEERERERRASCVSGKTKAPRQMPAVASSVARLPPPAQAAVMPTAPVAAPASEPSLFPFLGLGSASAAAPTAAPTAASTTEAGATPCLAPAATALTVAVPEEATPTFLATSSDPVDGGPTFFFDRACINQSNIDDDLACLPVHLAGCKKLLLLCGPTYSSRLWCIMELFTFIECKASLDEHNAVDVMSSVDVIPVLPESAHDHELGGEKSDAAYFAHASALFDGFDAHLAQCYRLEDRHRLLAIVESAYGSLGSFNTVVADCFGRAARAQNAEGHDNSSIGYQVHRRAHATQGYAGARQRLRAAHLLQHAKTWAARRSSGTSPAKRPSSPATFAPAVAPARSEEEEDSTQCL